MGRAATLPQHDDAAGFGGGRGEAGESAICGAGGGRGAGGVFEQEGGEGCFADTAGSGPEECSAGDVGDVLLKSVVHGRALQGENWRWDVAGL